jgi:hypothetical protein
MTWAARYAFCDPLWRGRSRLVVDAELELVLRAAVEGQTDAASRPLLEALIPRERTVSTWMVVGSEPTARLLAPYFGGVRFIPADAIDDRFARLPWESALVTLDRRVDIAAITAPARLGVTVRTVEGILVDVAAASSPGRIAVVFGMGEDLDYEGFVEQLRPTFGEFRIYGGYAPEMFAFAEFSSDDADDDAIAGEFDTTEDDPQTLRLRRAAASDEFDDSIDSAYEDELDERLDDREPGAWDDDDAPDDDDDAVPLSFDNTLGPSLPPYSLWIGVVGSMSEFGEGLTLLELPTPAAMPGDRGVADVTGALRLQLHETRKVAELGALERQRLVERIDAAEAENAGLRDAVAQLREQLAGALDPAVGGERLDAALAREQSLRWRVAALEREVAELRVRPVDELTAQIEVLRAQLEARSTEGPSPVVRNDHAAASVSPGGATQVPTRPPHNPDAARRLGTRAAGSGRTAALRVVEGLMRRVERGALERTALRRELVALRRRLGR